MSSLYIVPHDERNEDDMDDDVDRMSVVGTIESELLEMSEVKYGLTGITYLFSDVKQVGNGHGRCPR